MCIVVRALPTAASPPLTASRAGVPSRAEPAHAHLAHERRPLGLVESAQSYDSDRHPPRDDDVRRCHDGHGIRQDEVQHTQLDTRRDDARGMVRITESALNQYFNDSSPLLPHIFPIARFLLYMLCLTHDVVVIGWLSGMCSLVGIRMAKVCT
jgi:hypothetical protein